jgi:thioredoxin
VSETAASALGETSDARFDQEVLGAAGPVLVEFYATWCGNCRRFAPTLKKLAGEYAGRVPVVQVNADENPELARRYGVSSTPTLVLFTAREAAGTLVGAQPEDAVRELLETVAEGRPSDESVPAPLAWAPVDACTLPTAEQPLREAEFDALFAEALRRTERPEPELLRLILDGDSEVEAVVRDLTARESSCCSFFDFQLTAGDGELAVDVRVPEARIEVLDGLAHEAEAARTGAGTGSGAIV